MVHVKTQEGLPTGSWPRGQVLVVFFLWHWWGKLILLYDILTCLA